MTSYLSCNGDKMSNTFCSPFGVVQSALLALPKKTKLDISTKTLGDGTHYSDVTMGAIASQITSLTIVYSTVYSDADQGKPQSSAS